MKNKGKNPNGHNSEFDHIINGKQGYLLWGIAFVLIAYLGCIGNILVIIVLRKDPIMSTLTYLLIALAISDILAPQANALLGFSYYHLSSKYGNSVAFLKFENILRYIIHPLSTMFTMSSSWIVTLTTLFRLIAVKWPFTARYLLDKKKALYSLFVIFSLSFASIIPLYTNLTLKIKQTPDYQYNYFAFEIGEISDLMKTSYTPILLSLCFYLPWSLALIFWIFLIKSLRNSSNQFPNSICSIHYTSNNSNRQIPFVNMKKSKSLVEIQSERGRLNSMANGRISLREIHKNSYNKITLMVSILCFTSLMCRIFTFSNILEIAFNHFQSKSKNPNSIDKPFSYFAYHVTNVTSRDEAIQRFTRTTLENNKAKLHFPLFFSYSLLLNNIFLCIDHSVNIFIYSMTNPRFKKDLKIILKNFFSCLKIL